MQYKLINKNEDDNSAVGTIMNNRSILSKDIFHFCNPTEQDVILNSLLRNMTAGIKMLIKHIK